MVYETLELVVAISGKSLLNQDILLDKPFGKELADWDTLPIKRIWGIFSFDREDSQN